jgi:hypothetical protein
MKKLLFGLTILFSMILSIKGQTVTGYTYLFDNGINVKIEHGWSHVWIQQNYEAFKTGEQTSPIAVNIRTLGDLILSGSTIKLISAGKEVKMQAASPGTYDLKITAKLSGKPGTLNFTVGNVIIKPKTKTTLSVTLYDYQIMITETPGSFNGLSSYESSFNSYKGSVDQNPVRGIFSFYAKGTREPAIKPDESTSDTKGKIKPGVYNVLITVGISGQKHEVWLENFVMKPDVSYKISTNLNGGVIVYTGGNKDVKSMHLYPAGTAAQQTAKPVQDKTREIISYDNIKLTHSCSPGSYDVLLNFGGNKFEWRKGIVVQTGVRSEVK